MNIEKSCDGTVKLNFDRYSAVLIRIGGKNTLCLSSQVGCAMGCLFCVSGKKSFERNLTLDELKEQLDVALEYLNYNEEDFLSETISSIVFMGMGEPLFNLENVLAFCDYLNLEYGYAYSRVLVSTCGITDKMREVIDKYSNKVQLAVSLHSPFQEVRDLIMPGLKGFKILDLVEVINRYNEVYRQKIMIEYVMINGVNDRDCDLEALLGMGFARRTNFNLIPLNGKFVLNSKDANSSSKERIELFRKRLIGFGYKCFVRTKFGDDVGASCGMIG